MQQELDRDGSVIQVLVVASSIVLQAGLAALLTTEPGLEVVGQVADLAALDDWQPELPDVIVLHWPLLHSDRLPRLDLQWGPPLLAPNPAVVMWVDDWQGEAVPLVLQAGVRGVLSAEATAAELVAAIAAVAQGLTVLHPDLSEALLAGVPPPLPPVTPQVALTAREVEVLTMLAEGLGNKAIARRLAISEHTVKFHIGSIFSKLQASSRTEAVILGARQGLILL